MNPIEEYLFNPDPKIGGATVPLVGPPGSGKTIALTQIGLRNLKEFDHTIIWRGTKQAQWAHFLANNVQVTLWNHESVEDFEAFITANQNNTKTKINLEEKQNLQIKTWKDTDELIENLDNQTVNVINLPGLQGDTQDTEHHLYFLRKTWIDIFDSIIDRQNLQFLTMLLDEAGDLFPCQQQLRKPYYKLIVEWLPPKLSQLRKQNCFFYPAAHSTHDMHYFLWKVKSNSIIYKSNALVKNDITPGIDQSFVSNMERGEFAMPYKSKDHFELPNEKESLGWIPEELGRELRLDWVSNPPNLLEKEEGKENSGNSVDGRQKDNMSKSEAAKKVWEEVDDFTQKDAAKIFGITRNAISEVSK